MDTSSILSDLKSGFSVFLIALPLCLGIAVASNCPPIAGILTAVIGGLVSTFFGSAKLTIKGPAAGLIVILLEAVTELGHGDLILGYKRALAVACLAAIIQIVVALYKKAALAELMPSAIIHGMLAAIGVIIIAKQSHIMMGVVPTSDSPLTLLAEIPTSLTKLNPLIFVLGLICLAVTMYWPKFKKISFIPSALCVVTLAITATLLFDINSPSNYFFLDQSYALGPQFLISLPHNILTSLSFPDFSQVLSFTSLKYVLMFFFVGSIESLLTVCAVDSISPEKKQSDLNSDLFATGIGNLLASLIGGIPMISEIARSKANVNYGAKSHWSNFFHGLFMLIAMLFFSGLISLIPFATLAALLVYVGYSLAKPNNFIHSYQVGKDQLLIFLTTFIVTLTTDLLIGVAIGIVAKVFLHTLRGVKPKDFFHLDYKSITSPDKLCFKFQNNIVFSNYLELKKLINDNDSDTKTLVIDLSNCNFIDHTIQVKLDYLKKEMDEQYLRVEGLDQLYSASKDPCSVKYSLRRNNA